MTETHDAIVDVSWSDDELSCSAGLTKHQSDEIGRLSCRETRLQTHITSLVTLAKTADLGNYLGLRSLQKFEYSPPVAYPTSYFYTQHQF